MERKGYRCCRHPRLPTDVLRWPTTCARACVTIARACVTIARACVTTARACVTIAMSVRMSLPVSLCVFLGLSAAT
eukprot:3011594-Rhodomonas_salina.1